MFNLSGTWNQASYSQYHTQSTRTRALSDGGSTGGLDDRFDMMLNSTAMTMEGKIKYIPGSLVPFGNDGNHFNDSINMRPNTAVPDSIADALYYASDHLPVYAKYKFDVNTTSVSSISSALPDNFRLGQNYPNPFNPNTKIDFDIPDLRSYGSPDQRVTLKIYDILGNEVETLVDEELSAGKYTAEFNASALSSGSYFYRLTAGRFTQTKSMTLIK
ncbi:MAG: T9SS type A sorting domain-containing protein [Bacteroidetes bacterium]|nr:T9SS type A sorting domain-containing protein [Bacteroidota bacterium]